MAEVRPAQILSPFLPRYLLEHLGRAEHRFDEADMVPVAGTFLFADFTGFTRLTEELTHVGSAGTEQLSEILNSSFEPLIALVREHGGDVIKFAGDALLALWSVGDAAEGGLLAARRALACGLAMQEALHGRGDDRLRLRVAIASGPARVFHVGGVLGRWEYMVAGPPLDEVGALGGMVAPGSVAVAPALVAQFRGAGVPLVVADESERMVTVASLGDSPALPTSVPGIPQELDWERVAAYIPAAVRHLLGAGDAGYLGEIRSVSVLFLRLRNVNHDTPLEEAQRVMCALQEACYRYEGSINKLSVDDKGVSLLIATGLPPMVHEDDARRAVRIALDARAVVGSMAMNCAIGVATGPVYCGVIGSAERREYTIIGRAVNMAARLMTQAHDTILCDAETSARCADDIVFDTAAPAKVKGRQSAIWVSRPIGPRRVAGRAGRGVALAGRGAELRNLDAALNDLLASGTASNWWVEGAAGMGKSALLRRFAWSAARRGARVIEAAGQGLDSASSWHPWRALLGGWLALDGLANAEQRYKVMAILEAYGVADQAPVLNPLFAFDFEPTEAAESLTGPARAERMRELVFRLLRHSQTRTQVLILDDLHTFDPASMDLLQALLPRLPAQLVVASRRPGQQVPEVLEGAQTLTLGPLGEADINVAVRMGLGVDEMPGEAARFIAARARGVPLFALELARHLVAVGALVIEGRRANPGRSLAEQLALPGTVEGVIAARIDRLPVRGQLALKIASVIGRAFSLAELQALQASDSEWQAELDALQLSEFVVAVDEARWEFTSPLVWQVARNQMLGSQRRDLHARYARWLEGQARVDPARLAGHWWGAQDTPRAVEWTSRALDLAAERHATAEVAELIEQALERVDGERDLEPLTHAHWLRLGGEACNALDRVEDARDYLVRGLEVAGTPLDPTLSVGAAALRELLSAAPGVAAGLRDDVPMRLEAAHMCHELSVVMFRLNDRAGLIQATIKGLNLARATPGAVSLLARIRANIAYACALLGYGRLSARFSRLALEAMDEAGGDDTAAWVQLPLGAVALAEGHWERSRELLRAGRDAARRMNHFMRICEYQTSRLMIECLVGDIDRAESGYRRLQTDSEERGSTQTALWGAFGSARLMARRGQDEALDLMLGRIGSLLQYKARGVSGRRGDLFEWYGLDALRALRRRDQAAAEEAVRCALGSLESATQPHFLFPGFQLAMAAHMLANLDPNSSHRRDLADQSRELLRGYARFAPIGVPIIDYFDADAQWRAGNDRRALQLLDRARVEAARLGMAFEEAAMIETLVARFAERPGIEDLVRRHAQLAARFGLERLPFGLRRSRQDA